MKKFSKKVTAIILSVVLVVTMIPAFAISTFGGTTTNWTVAASSDFTQAAWTSTGSAVKNVGNPLTCGYAPTTSAGGEQVAWSGYEWTNTYMNTDENGANIADGLIYLSGTSNGQTPITGASAFKVDIEFMFTGDYSVTSRASTGNVPVFLKLVTYPTNLTFEKGDIWKNAFFTQEAYGRSHIGDTYDVNKNTEGGAQRITTDNLAKNKIFHYVITLEDGYLSERVEDEAGDVYINYGGYQGSFNTSTIHGIYIGSANENYYHNLAIKSVVMSTGETTKDGTKKFVDPAKDKYLFTYFTGNSEEGETLHMAVSDDGKNWEALNGNSSIWDSSKLTGSETSYPDNSGIAATGHVRDPYAFQAQDGSYYVLATDLNTENGTNWGNNSKMMVWHLNSMADLANTNPWYIDTMSIMRDAGITDYVSRAWAPEAIWDPEAGHYMLFWGCGYVNCKTRMYYAYTDDFKTLLTRPAQLLNTDIDNIDGNITYDGTQYVMWFKDETNKKIGYATSNHASGPYGAFHQFEDGWFNSSFEGPEVYQLQDGSYVLMADHYSSKLSYFSCYSSQDLLNFSNGRSNDDRNINYLEPRHGSVINITTKEYNKLVSTYGKATYDATGVETGKTANDYLIARYFTNSDVSNDATGHNHTLTTIHNVDMTPDFNGRTAAHFAGTASDNTKDNAASSTGDSYTKNGSYASVNVADMLKDTDMTGGVTFSWYGYAENANAGRWFDWSTASTPGSLSWDNELGTGQSQSNNAYIYSASNMRFGADNLGVQKIADGYTGTGYKGSWHLYTYTVSKEYITFAVDGALLKYVYAQNGESVNTVGSPIRLESMNQSFVDLMKNANLYFGISSYAADEMLNGYISDFRVYNRALSVYDIDDSIADLSDDYPNESLGDGQRVYYDPMEDMDTNKDGVNDKNAYSQTVVDELQGNVLNLAGGVFSQYPYYGSSTDKSKGYTVSMWFNPGSSVDGDYNIFCIGSHEDLNNERRYFQVLENGNFYYVWDGTVRNSSYIDCENVFGEAFKPNTWYHLAIQIKPDGDYDKIYFYRDGNLTKTVNFFTESGDHHAKGRSIHDFLAADRNVYYGYKCVYWNSSANGYLDDFSIYNNTYSVRDIFAQDCDDIAETLIPKCMKDYKDKMDELTGKDYVFTNMGDAYEAYDRCSRYLDATELGKAEKNVTEIVTLYNELEDAIKQMEVYRKPATVQGYTQSGKTDIPEKYTHNMLTQPSLVYTAVEQDEKTTDNFTSALSTSNYTWLYTGIEGDTPTAPYSSQARKQNSSTTGQRITSIYVSNGVPMQFGGAYPNDTDDAYWHQNNTQNGENTSNWVYSNYHNTFTMDGTDNGSHWGVDMTAKKWYCASGYSRFTGNMDTFKTDTASDITYKNVNQYYKYLLEFTPQFITRKRWNAAGSAYKVGGNFANDRGTVRVINYELVRNVLLNADRIAKLATITEYSPESCKKFVKAYDDLTSEEYRMDTPTQAETLAKTLKTEVDTLEGVKLEELVKKADGSVLVDEAKTQTPFYEAATKESNTQTVDGLDVEIIGALDDKTAGFPALTDDKNKQLVYTLSSWAAYENAYNNLTKYFTDLNPYGDNDPYATSQTQLDRLVTNMKKAQSSLQPAADYDPVDTSVLANKDQHSAGLGQGSAQNYAYYLWDNYDKAYNEADAWYQKDAAYRADTERYNVQYTTTISRNGVTLNYGPYIAYDVNGNVVTSDDQQIDSYKFIGNAFYDNAGDKAPSQFETGDYIKVGNEYIKLNGHRYYVDDVNSTDDNSARQDAIITSGSNLNTTQAALRPVANYEAYNEAVDLLKYQDMAAFNADYINKADSPYGIVTANGTKSTSVTYKNGVSKSKTCATPAYAGVPETAYIVANKRVYKNASIQTELDSKTSGILSALNAVNKGTDSTKRATYTVTFKENDTQKSADTHYYGEAITLNPTSGTPYKWKVTVNGTTKTVPAYASYTLNVQADTTVEVWTSSDEVAANYVRVKILDFAGNQIDQYDVSDTTTLSFDGGTCTLGGAVINSPVMPFYEFTGWNINGAAVTTGTSKTVSEYNPANGVLEIKAKCKTTAGELNIDFDGKPVENNGFESYITLQKPDNAYAIAYLNGDKIYVATYDNQYSYYAPSSQSFVSVYFDADAKEYYYNVNDEKKVINDYEAIQKLDQKLPFTYSVAYTTTDGSGFTNYSSPTLGSLGGAVTNAGALGGIVGDAANVPSNAVITERGTLYAQGANWTNDTMVIGTSGVYRRAAKEFNASGQYYFKVTCASTLAVSTRSYIKYTCTVNGVTVQAISYGNICSRGQVEEVQE